MMRNIFRIHKRILMCLTLVTVLFCLSACEEKPAGDQNSRNQLFYISVGRDCIVSTGQSIEIEEGAETVDIMNQMIDYLKESPDESKYVAVIDEESGFVSAHLEENQAFVDFDNRFLELDSINAILIRAALTRSLTNISGIDMVSFTIEGTPMLDSTGQVIGPLGADNFIDNAGTQIIAQERTKLSLYFANESGDKLVKVNRTVVYSGNISMDKLVVEQLIKGVMDGENGKSIINPSTSIINVTTQDGTCYVNLSSDFSTSGGEVLADVVIYSLVDSLVELGTINKVQILIDSNSDSMFRETISLSTPFERNLDLIEE